LDFYIFVLNVESGDRENCVLDHPRHIVVETVVGVTDGLAVDRRATVEIVKTMLVWGETRGGDGGSRSLGCELFRMPLDLEKFILVVQGVWDDVIFCLFCVLAINYVVIIRAEQ
jgi:hypothetical protein